MKMNKLLALILALLLLSGCAAVGEEPLMTRPFVRYYRAAGGESLLADEVVDLGEQMPDYTAILNDYFAGPHLPGLLNPFPPDLRCEGVTVRDGVAEIRLSMAFTELAGIELTTAAAAIAKTMEQFDEIRSVCLQTDEVMLSELWNTPFSSSEFLFFDTASQTE